MLCSLCQGSLQPAATQREPWVRGWADACFTPTPGWYFTFSFIFLKDMLRLILLWRYQRNPKSICRFWIHLHSACLAFKHSVEKAALSYFISNKALLYEFYKWYTYNAKKCLDNNVLQQLWLAKTGDVPLSGFSWRVCIMKLA
jgi:hypothetical protein